MTANIRGPLIVGAMGFGSTDDGEIAYVHTRLHQSPDTTIMIPTERASGIISTLLAAVGQAQKIMEARLGLKTPFSPQRLSSARIDAEHSASADVLLTLTTPEGAQLRFVLARTAAAQLQSRSADSGSPIRH